MPKTKKYEIVTDKLQDISLYDLESSVQDCIEYLQKIINTYSNHHNLRIDVNFGYEGAYDYTLYGDRQETDTERDKRLKLRAEVRAQKKKQREKKEQQEQLEYQRLHKKYGGSNDASS